MNRQPAPTGFIELLSGLLADVTSRAGDGFSGIGLIICDTPQSLPILPLRDSAPKWAAGSKLADFLAGVSQTAGLYHDGFHVLSSSLKPVAIAQYFSPPIVPGIVLDRSRHFGGRYVAALLGSALIGVRATGIASRDFGIAIFERGQESWFGPTQ
ncbi:hypothetical protein [Novosphingobium kaempferiae]|uniref:hypothetical protein n=1 Tax=Novosphingobium kaempferiae TaxID=2896849 RepID=UPI001E2A7089|nr:hypothetical protein [Novosphingobium kaempferiae]